MAGMIIIERANGRVDTKEVHDYADVDNAKSEYVFIASAWDYTARIGNPINYYFRDGENE